MEEVLNRGIKGIIDEYPEVGNILDKYGIGCVPCAVGTCLLGDIVDIHGLSPEDEQQMMTKIAGVIYPGENVEAPLRQRDAEARPAELTYSPPMQKLVNEHKLIKRWVALIPAVVDSIDLGSPEGRQLILDGLDFIRSYADKFHHAKEEEILFSYFDEDLDILKVMHEDHEAARAHVRAVSEAVEKEDESSAGTHLLAYREILEEHVKKEDEVLYPWLDRQLSDTQVGTLYSQFAEVDRSSGDTQQRYEHFIEELEMTHGADVTAT